MASPDVQSCVGKEARSRPRVSSGLACRVSLDPLGEKTLGTVQDIHEEGARVSLHSDLEAVEGPVELEIEGRRFLANLSWRNGRAIGLHFVADLTHAQEEMLHHLRAALEAMKRA